MWNSDTNVVSWMESVFIFNNYAGKDKEFMKQFLYFLKEEVLLNFQICNESQIFNAFFSENVIVGKTIWDFLIIYLAYSLIFLIKSPYFAMNNCTFINNYPATSSLDNSIFFAIFDYQICINGLIVTNNSFSS